MIPLLAPDKTLMTNTPTARAGWVKVEVVGKAGRGLAECVPIVGDKPWSRVTWKGGDDLGIGPGEPVTLRVEMRQAKVFGLEFD